jgi:hypothetical protein
VQRLILDSALRICGTIALMLQVKAHEKRNKDTGQSSNN